MLVDRTIYAQNFYTNNKFPVNQSKNKTIQFLGDPSHLVNSYLRGDIVTSELLRSLKLYKLELQDVLVKMIDRIIEKNEISAEDRINFQEVFKKVFDIIHKEENKLGEGSLSSVYEINEKYALRCPNDAVKSDIDNIKTSLYVPFNRFRNLKTFYGNELMSFGKARTFSIIYNLGEHTPAGAPQNISKESEYQYYLSEYLPTFSKVPQESYDAIVQDCAELNNLKSGIHYYTFDYDNPSNIVLKDGKLFWVDAITDTTNPNTITQLLEMLLLKLNPWETVYHEYGNATADAQKIFSKILLASARSKLQIGPPRDNSIYNIWRTVLGNLNAQKSTNYVVRELKRIYNISNSEARVEETNKLLNGIFSASENI